MKQRVLTAMATGLNPALLLADEPTTALDVTIQEQILGLLAEIRDRARHRDHPGHARSRHRAPALRPRADHVCRPHRRERRHRRRSSQRRSIPIRRRCWPRSRRSATSAARLQAIEGTIPDLRNLPPGCSFAPRCPHAMPRCTRGISAAVRCRDERGALLADAQPRRPRRDGCAAGRRHQCREAFSPAAPASWRGVAPRPRRRRRQLRHPAG